MYKRQAEKLDCTIEIVRREGAPYTLAKLRHRQALAVGIAACGAAVLIGSFFVWDIQIAGNETVPREVILRSLENNGVHRGCFGFALNGEDIRNHVLLEIPELSWVAVNVSGCRANVEVRERRTAPKPLDRKTPCNLVARRDGLVLRVQALGGVPQVMKGMSVTEGQLLISGVEDTGTFGTRFTAGLGSVEGRTWYTLTANVPLTGAEKRYTGREKRLHSVIFGSRRIKFFANSSIDSGQCDKITERTPVRVCGLPLPITWETETLRFYETEPVTVTQARRQKETGAALEAYLHSLVDPYGEVTASQVAVSYTQLTRRFLCENKERCRRSPADMLGGGRNMKQKKGMELVTERTVDGFRRELLRREYSHGTAESYVRSIRALSLIHI